MQAAQQFIADANSRLRRLLTAVPRLRANCAEVRTVRQRLQANTAAAAAKIQAFYAMLQGELLASRDAQLDAVHSLCSPRLKRLEA